MVVCHIPSLNSTGPVNTCLVPRMEHAKCTFNGFPCLHSVNEGDTLLFECLPGFTHTDAKIGYLTCLQNGSFAGTPPACRSLGKLELPASLLIKI